MHKNVINKQDSPAAGGASPGWRDACRSGGKVGGFLAALAATAMKTLGLEAMTRRHYRQAAHHFAQAMGFDRQAVARLREPAQSPDIEMPSAALERARQQWKQSHSRALMTLHSALHRFGPQCDLMVQIGLFYCAQGELSQGSQWLRRAAQADCSSADAHYHLGLALSAQQDMAAAARCFQQALKLRPDDLLCAYQLAMAAAAVQEAGSHIHIELCRESCTSPHKQLASYLLAEPDLVESCLSLVQMPQDRPLLEALRAALWKALEGHVGYADLHYRYSSVAMRLGRTDEATAHARKALQINPRYTKALLRLGELAAQDGSDRQALSYLREAIACGADWPEVHCMAADLLGRLAKQGQARRHLQRALKINPNYRRAADALASLAA